MRNRVSCQAWSSSWSNARVIELDFEHIKNVDQEKEPEIQERGKAWEEKLRGTQIMQ